MKFHVLSRVHFCIFELQFIFFINTDNDNREIHVNAYTVIMIGRCSVRGRGREGWYISLVVF